ncbi:hypothetical protein [Streptomyces sp. JJ36]|uniref:hypothetical protein n=1 Tax=Streptomyces sp. JJ36 TaxID=2736645 RepID=UPI001F47426A|nr:hypothetical protein [Streptomyces sp. JJ36]MCF6525399.1 hypothetical protein [Streptomyces sp. JJ36]
MRKHTRRRMTWGAALVTATAATCTVGATMGGPPDGQARQHTDAPPKPRPTHTRPVESRQIASSVLGRDLKFTLTALRSQADPLAASVELRVFTFRGGTWKESDRTTVGETDGFFWFPLTGRQAICTFSTASTEPAPVAVSLLVTPSIGCSPTENFEVENGRFTSG